MTIPSLTDSSSLYGQYDRITGSKSLIELGHPAVMIPCSWSNTGSALVSFLISFRRSLLNLTKSTLMSRSIVSVFSALGRRLRVSARVISCPEMYLICILSLVEFICVAAGVWNASSFLTVQWEVISLSYSSDGSPSTAGPCTSTMWKVLTCQSDLLYWQDILMLLKHLIGMPS